MKICLDSIKSMILKRSLGGLQIGDSKDQILQCLGEPLDFLPQKKRNKAILSYGALQLYLLDGRLSGLTFDNQKADFFEKRFCLEKIGYSDFLSVLDEERLNYSLDNSLLFQAGVSIKVEGHFYFCFLDEDLIIFGFSEVDR